MSPSDGEGIARSYKGLAPHVLTLAGMSLGLCSLHLTYDRSFLYAGVAVGLAAIFDGLDGALARGLNVQSRFGTQLDSLSDFLSFGVAPAFLVYEAVLRDHVYSGAAVSMLYVIAACLRLARYNLERESSSEYHPAAYAMGLPTTAAAIALLGVHAGATIAVAEDNSVIILVLEATLAALMISSQPIPRLTTIIVRIASLSRPPRG